MANQQSERERKQVPGVKPVATASYDAPTQRELAFKTFGVMDAGKQGTGSVITSLLINGAVVLLAIAISLTAKTVMKRQELTTLVAPVTMKPEEPPKPKPPVLRPPPPKPPEVKLEQPKIKLPTIEVPEPPKIQPVIMKPAPIPVITPAPPKAVTPPPAPKQINIAVAQAASVPNNSPKPAAIRVGSMTNPINNTSGPAVSTVNLGRSGAPGMNAANTGLGNPSKIALSGSGSPNGSMGGRDNAAQPVKGVSLGITGGTGPMTAKPPAGAVQIAQNNVPRPIATTVATAAPTKVAPKLLYKPRPEYTDEARALKLEGTVYVKIHVSASGAVSVVGVQSGLGHGLDQAALHAVQGMKFQPAMQNGQPADWDGVVNINFQLAGG